MGKKNLTKSITVVAVVLSVLAVAIVGVASAKSLYVIADISGVPIQAYDIQSAPTYLDFQAEHTVPDWGAGAVGLTIDTDSEMLFVTYEGSNTIQLLDAKTMADEGTTTATGAYNLAGIVVDQEKQKVYTIDRNTNHLYVYTWDATAKTLTLEGPTYKTLSGVSNGQGLALDEVHDLLYVGDMVASNNIRVFSTADWSLVTSYTVSQPVQGIAVDVTNGIIYTGHAGWPPASSLHLLCKLDIGTGIENNVDIRTLTTSDDEDAVVGLAVDPETSLLYITTGNQGSEGRVYDDTDQIIVFDSNLNPLKYPTGDIGDPTGLCVPGKDIGYNPLNFEKDDDVSTCVEPGDTFTYTMPYSNGNPQQVTGVTIVDTLPSEVTYASHTTSRGTCTLSPSGDTLTCDIGTLLSGDSGSVTLTVSVNAGTPAGTTITNSAVINGNEANTGPTTKDVETDVCPAGGGNCCACPAGSDPGDPCVCTQAADQNDCVNNLNGTWVGQDGCVPGTTTGCEGLYCQDGQCIPEFSTIALPVASILGLLFYFNYRKRKREQ